ncbi:MAG: acyl-CoA thioesterase, partial [Candidatus Omnitrophica bacterium]|nr:acyl-CoA thioesterase [Candidatus Omnitrophota bacterium]
LEEARTEYLASCGLSVKELSREGTMFVVSRQEIDYKSPAVYGDSLHIETRVVKTTGVRILFDYTVTDQDNKIIVEAKTTLVCVDKDLKPQAIPEGIRQRFPA